MKIPETPPDVSKILEHLRENNPSILLQLVEKATPLDTRGHYLPWDKVKYLPLPDGFKNHELWWAVMKIARTSAYRKPGIRGINGVPLRYVLIDSFSEILHFLDQFASGHIAMEQPILNPQLKNYYVINSLIEGSITTSQLEGATTTRDIAKKMLQEGRSPRNISERMILNNYEAINYIRTKTNEDLSPEFIREIHSVISKETLDKEKVGQYRNVTDDIHVTADSQIIFTPPASDEIEERLKELCDFANGSTDNGFIHPVVKAIILHFVFAYIHPFVDGNGRTARALFYWMMIKKGYWFTEFISISRILKKAPAKYSYSFLYAETDENDITYFIDYQLGVVKQAIEELKKYIKRKMDELASTEKLLRKTKLTNRLNFRQLTLLKSALKNPGSIYTIQEYKNTHKVVYQTARKDLLELSDTYHLLEKIKRGKGFFFIVPSDLSVRISESKNISGSKIRIRPAEEQV